MACRYTYQGKTYEAQEFDDVLRAMKPVAASQYMPSVKSIPDAPFIGKTDAYVALALKRMISYAAENGFDKIAFVNGEQSAERYDLSKQVGYIDYVKRSDGTFNVSVVDKDERTEVFTEMGIGLDRIEAVVGKEIAQKIADGNGQRGRGSDVVTLRGLDLKVGGEGMKAFYDKIVPAVAKDVLRKLGGGQMGNVKLAMVSALDVDYTQDAPGFDITPAMRDKAATGLPMFARPEPFATRQEANTESLKEPGTVAIQDDNGGWVLTPRLRAYNAKEIANATNAITNINPLLVRAGVAPAQVLRNAPSAELAWGRSIGRTLGYEVIFIENNPDFDGVAIGGKAFVSPNEKHPELAVVGHEVLHTLKQTDPDAYRALSEQIRPYLKTGIVAAKRQWEDAQGGTNTSQAVAEEEVIADLNGAMWLDPKFWGEMAQNDPSLFRKVAYKFMELVSKVMKATSRFKADSLVTDVDAVRSIIAREWAAQAQENNADEGGMVPAFSRDETTPGAVKKLQSQLAAIEAEYEPLRKRKAFGAEWSDVEARASAVMDQLSALTGDPYGKKTVKLQKPSDDVLNAEYSSPEDVPQNVRAWVEKNASILTSDATDAVRWGRITDTLKDDRYPSGDLTIYRAVADGDEIRAGDWVTTERKYAEMHLAKYLNGKGQILEETVNGRDVLVSPTGNSEEAIFAPRKLSGPVANEPTAPDSGGARQTDIRYSRAQPGTPFDDTLATDGWTMPEPTKTDKLIYNLQDGRIDLKRVQEAIKATGAEIAEKFDARQAETLYPGRVARRSETFLKIEVKPLLQDMALNKIDMAELGDYLIARHATERNAQIAKVNPELPDGGAGSNSQGVLMTDDAAAEYLAAIPADKLAKLVNLARKVDAITAGTRALLVGEGLEKQKTVDAWTSAYKNYVPLFKDEAEHSHPQGRGFTVKGSASKRSTGSTKEVTNVLAHVLMQRETAITRAEKNRVGLALYGLALSNPNADFWATIKPNMTNEQIMAELQAMGVDPLLAGVGMVSAPTVRTVDPLTDKVVDRPNPMYKNLPGAITLRVNGEDRVLMLNQDNERAIRMATNLKNLDGVTNLELASTIIGKSTRWIASVNTQYNPAFGLINVTRDTLGGIVNLTNTPLRYKKMKVLANVPAALKGIARDLRGDTRTEWSDLFNQFQDDGGQTGYKEMFRTADDRAQAIEKEIAAAGKSGLAPGKMAHAVLDLLDDFNTALENSVRVSAYKAALDEGMSRPAAAKLARELTVDFNRKGRLGREVAPLYAFFNASVQGTARTIEALAGPAGAKIIAGGLALGALQALMLAFAGFDDDEPPEFIKSRSLIIPIGDKRYVAIPYPLGLHVIPNTGRVLTELSINGGKNIGKRAVEAVGEIAGAFNPMGGGNIFTTDGALRTLAPTIIDPLIELGFNKNFAGFEIEKRPFYEEGDNRPGFQRARESTQRTVTGQAYLSISKAVNTMTGGNDFEAGEMSPTPERIRYLAQVAGGGVLRELEKSINASMGLINDEEVAAHGIPVVGRFYGEIDSNQTERSGYFETAKTIKKYETSRKAADKAGASEIADNITKKHPEVEMAHYLNKVQERISKLNKLAAETINDRAALKQIDEDRFEIMKDLNDEIKLMERSKREPTIAERLRK